MKKPLTSEVLIELVNQARAARLQAYAPYSDYLVGSAVLTASGNIYTGCNVENASYPASICAERVAITKSVSHGERDIVAIAVVTANGGAPCGICRQVMNEFGPTMHVVIATDTDIQSEHTLSDLLPKGFGPGSLPD